MEDQDKLVGMPPTSLVDRDGRIADLHFRRTSAQFDWQPCPSIGYLGLLPAAVVSRRGQLPLSDCRGAAVAHGEFVASVIVSIMAVGL